VSRRRVVLLLACAAAALSSSTALAAPSITVTPAAPGVCRPVAFTAVPDPGPTETPAAYRWDFEGDGSTVRGALLPGIAHTYRTAGPRTVHLQVLYASGTPPAVTRTDETSLPIDVQAAAPTVSFTRSPASPLSESRVSFDARATAPPGQTLSGFSWDLNGDGVFGDAAGSTASASYPFPGQRIVRVLARSDCGGQSFEADAAQALTIGNRSPTASIRFLPSAPKVGDTVDFISLARDPDGPVVAELWDLDNDGRFDDASGPTASRAFSTPGGHTVSLRAYDSSGARVSAFASVEVAPTTRAAPTLLSPFPVVRIVGQLTRSGARIRLLSMRLPRGVTVTVKCKGRSCPYHRRSYRPKRHGLRLRKLERSLRAGTTLKLYISKPGRIGKYTSFTIRRGKAPRRTDLCIRPGKRPGGCPSS
jgi:PKD repeat protein